MAGELLDALVGSGEPKTHTSSIFGNQNIESTVASLESGSCKPKETEPKELIKINGIPKTLEYIEVESTPIEYNKGDKFKEYEIIEFLGEGGMGIVYKAKDKEGKHVVIKFLLDGEMFKDDGSGEIDDNIGIVNFSPKHDALNHPNLIKLREITIDPEKREFYMVLDYLKGRVLCDLKYFEDDKIPPYQRKLSLIDRLDLSIDIMEAIRHINKNGAVHRDLKPENIMICQGAKGLEAKLFDFESMTYSGQVIKSGLILGSSKYLAPEQIEDNLQAPSLDIHAGGITIYELLSGKRALVAISKEKFEKDNILPSDYFHTKKDLTESKELRNKIRDQFKQRIYEEINKARDKYHMESGSYDNLLKQADILSELLADCFQEYDKRPEASEILQSLKEIREKINPLTYMQEENNTHASAHFKKGLICIRDQMKLERQEYHRTPTLGRRWNNAGILLRGAKNTIKKYLSR